jgi:hypothetical protein
LAEAPLPGGTLGLVREFGFDLLHPELAGTIYVAILTLTVEICRPPKPELDQQ